ncbi:hypothetical protein ACWD25_47960 [Streptomyces sp. NPDC002920]
MLDITGWTQDEIDTGVSLQTEFGQFGPGGRALYDPRPAPRSAGLGRRQPLTTCTRSGENTAAAEPSRDARA